MDTVDHEEEHLEQVIAKAMGGQAPAVNPLGVDAPASIPIHAGDELPQDCHGQADNLENWTHSIKSTRDASADELVRHAQYLEWRAGVLTGKAAALRSIATTR
jgi:hypothetical protein